MHVVAWLILALPLIVASICAFPRSERAASAVTIGASVAALACAAALISPLQRAPIVLVPGWVSIDAFSGVLLLLIALIATTAAIFSSGYVGPEHSASRTRLYYGNFNLFVFSMASIPMLAELGLVWIAVELTTLLSILLVSFSGTTQAIEAAWKYMVLTLLGATVAVLGILMLFWSLHAAGSTDFTWMGLIAGAHAMPAPLVKAAFALLLIGYGAKVGFVPLHTWLPDAHSQAPSPVCALLSGIETTVVLYVLLRLRGVFLHVPQVHVQTWFAVFGLISAGAAVLLMVQTHDFKRLFAFSTIEHMGIVLTAASFATPLGDMAAVWQILAHSVTKSFCFYAAGSVLLVSGTRRIASVSGMLGKSKIAASAMLIGALAISGAPPFALFLSELAILRAGLLAGQIAVTAILAAFIVIGFFGVLFHVGNMAFGSVQPDRPWPRLPVACGVALGIAAIPVIAFGLWIPAGIGTLFAQSAAALGL
jgi:hydrogenase-4 component F